MSGPPAPAVGETAGKTISAVPTPTMMTPMPTSHQTLRVPLSLFIPITRAIGGPRCRLPVWPANCLEKSEKGVHQMLVEKLSLDECRRALSEARLGRLGCAHDGQPYVVPTYFAVEDDSIYAFALPG